MGALQQARHGRIKSARPHPHGGMRSGLGAIATADLLARWRQPRKTPAAGGYRSPEARQPLGGRERSERGKRSGERGAPASQRGATAREEPRAPPQLGRERVARERSRRRTNKKKPRPWAPSEARGRGLRATPRPAAPAVRTGYFLSPIHVGQSSGGRRGCLCVSERK